ncbi:MAG TPA: hypothetical protein VKE74_00175, partial [Gemmataceae bacterium]|nr:hypothetical protein [Gemmataceae bacterium]
MFGFQLETDGWAAVVGATVLLGRVVYLLIQLVRRVTTDAEPDRPFNALGMQLSGVAVATLAVAAVSLGTGGLPQNVRIPAYIALAIVGFFLGAIFDFILSFRLAQLDHRLRVFRIP